MAHGDGTHVRAFWHAAAVTSDPAAWLAALPRKRMGAGALIRDEQGRVLLVQPTYTPTWEIPGGAVEADESPRACCAREIEEELGLRLPIGRLLCLEWQGREPERSESLMLVYDGGILTDVSAIRLPTDELASFRLVEPAELSTLLEARLVRRTLASLGALVSGGVAELENGRPVRDG